MSAPLLLARLHIEHIGGQTSNGRWRLSSSSVVCNAPRPACMQAASAAQARRWRHAACSSIIVPRQHCKAGQYGYVPLGWYLVINVDNGAHRPFERLPPDYQSACRCYRPHPQSPFIISTHPESRYFRKVKVWVDLDTAITTLVCCDDEISCEDTRTLCMWDKRVGRF